MSEPSQEKLTLLSVRAPRRRYLWALSLAMALYAGVLFDRLVFMASLPRGASSDFARFAQAWNLIDRYYVDRSAVNPSNMMGGAIRGMTEALGDNGHTAYLTPQARLHTDSALAAKLTGIGVEIQVKDRQPVILATLDDSPAWRAGLHAGDTILSVEGKLALGMPLDELRDLITGAPGTTVHISVLTPANVHRQFTLVRAQIKVRDVTWRMLPGTPVAHLRVAMFSDGAGRAVRAALLDIEKQGAKGVILDLRNNPGGGVEEAVTVASQFLSGGNVFLEKDAEGKITPMPVRSGGVATHLPVVVLINGGSASASEIVAGALRDANRAVLVGANTFGTGTVLQNFRLSDNSALLLAVAEWLTPSGQSFWHKGLKPDTEVAATNYPVRPDDEASLTPETLPDCGDAQLLRGLELLTAQF